VEAADDEPCAYVLFPEGTRTRKGEMGIFSGGSGLCVDLSLFCF